MMWLRKLFPLCKEQALIVNRSLSVRKCSTESHVYSTLYLNQLKNEKSGNKGPIIGIDFGTTISRVAVLDRNTPKILENKDILKKPPSFVTMANKSNQAKEQLLNIPEYTTMFSTQRLIVEWLRQPENQIYVQNPNNMVYIEKVYSYILGKLKESAESYLKTSVHGAVISHSAYDRDLVKSAAKNAGFIDVETIEEPAAIAIASGFSNYGKVTAIYDWGGGKFSIAIVKDSYDQGMSNVQATIHKMLGGMKFDDVLVTVLKEKLKKETSIDFDIRNENILRFIAIDAKIQLSQATEVEIKFPISFDNSYSPTNFVHIKFTRKQFENVIHDMLQETFSVSKEIIESSKTDLEDIDEVLLLGGMSKIPLVRKTVEEFFKKKPSDRIDPEGIVAVGALLRQQN